jgi:hypothetical protein
MPRWSAAQMLSRIALEKPSKLKKWPSDMEGRILPAQLKLHEAIAQGRISDVRGRRGPPGSKERIEELLRDSEFTLLVTPHGTLTVHPPHKRLKFIEKYGIDPDNWVREIDFDQDEGEQAFSAPLTPCQGRPDRPHLRLVPGARSGETEAVESNAASPKPKQPAPTKKTKKTRKTRKTKNRTRRRGPKPGEVKRYASADRKLFPAIRRLMRKEQLSLTAATQRLAENRRVAGEGTPASRAKRLSKLFTAEGGRARRPQC